MSGSLPMYTVHVYVYIQVTHYNKKHDELKETMEAYKRTAQLHADQVSCTIDNYMYM